ncbi:MAG: hypothetical protein QW700_08130 [Desulfurococcaceae archaeon]
MKRKGQLRLVEAVLAVFMTVAVLLMVMGFTRPLRSPYIRETSDLRRLAYNVLSAMAQAGTFENTLSERIWAILDSRGRWQPSDAGLRDLELFLSLSLPPGLLYRMDIYLLNGTGRGVERVYLGTAKNYDAEMTKLTEAESITFTYTITGAKQLSFAERFNFSALPGFITTLTSGTSNTGVYLGGSPNVGLITQVDSISDSTYGYAAAIYDVQSTLGLVPAAGFTFCVTGSYNKEASDRSNNVAQVSVGVDTDWDGTIDVEYIFYRYDISSTYNGSLVSILRSPGSLVCRTSSSGSCTAAPGTGFRVFGLGRMSVGGTYSWCGKLPYTSGRVLKIAFATVDDRYSAEGIQDDFWVVWDDFLASWSFENIRGLTLEVLLTIGYAG